MWRNMEEWTFWVIALGLATAVIAVLILAHGRMVRVTEAGTKDLAVYKDQLAEIDRDLARSTLTPEEAARLRSEVGRRVLDADRTRATGIAAGTADAPARGGSGAAVLVLLGFVILGGAGAAYTWLGAPGYPDMPLAARLADLDAGIAARPPQAEELARLNLARDPVATAALNAELSAITDPDALRLAFADRFQIGELTAAVLTSERILALFGAKATAADHANHALALVAEARGYVSPEAETALRAALSLDLSNEMARYLVGEMFLQGGRFDQTFRFWRPIVESGNPDAPWVASIRERIGMVAGLAGVSYEAPALAGPGAGPAFGPGADDIAAAANMTPEDRQAMIEGMVTQLSDRLASEGGDVEDWDRLIRSLATLERLPQAQTIYDEARVRFEGRPAELSFLRMAAVESGLNP